QRPIYRPDAPPHPPLPPPPSAAEARTSRDLSPLLASVRQAAGPEAAPVPPSRDLFGLISKVGLALLSPSGLDEVLPTILELVFDGIPAERALLFLRDQDGEAKLQAASHRDGAQAVENQRGVSREVLRQVLEEGRSVL